jgi:hypothetical protein
MATAAVVAPAIIQGASQIASGAMGGKGAKDAAKIQAQTADKALAFERETEARRQENFQKAYNLWEGNRRILAQRYGIDLPTSYSLNEVSPGGGITGPDVVIPTDTWLGGYGGLDVPPESPAANASQQGGNLYGLASQGVTQPLDISRWSDWSRYGLA